MGIHFYLSGIFQSIQNQKIKTRDKRTIFRVLLGIYYGGSYIFVYTNDTFRLR